MNDTRPVPHLWRGDAAAPAGRPEARPGRQRRVFGLLALILVLAGAVAGLLSWVTPPPVPDFYPLWVSGYDRRVMPTPFQSLQDRDALRDSGIFALAAPDAYSDQERVYLVRELASLRERPAPRPVVVYVSAYAAAGEGGEVYLYPGDAEPDDAPRLLPLREVLEALRACDAPHKLLVLDVFRPFAGQGQPAVPPGRLGVLIDDVPARVPALLDAVPDPRRLVLCACSPGQDALTSEVLGRSVFSYYLTLGLGGAADGSGAGRDGDGRVSAVELAAFVRDRVDRWAWSNRRTRQTPALYGDGPDFQLAAARPAADGAAALPEAQAYPGWLLDDWKKVDGLRADGLRDRPRAFRQLEALVLRAEQRWRAGVPAAEARSDHQVLVDRLQAQLAEARQVGLNPVPRSLAALRRQGFQPDDKFTAEVQQLLAQEKSQTEGLAADKAKAARDKLIADFASKHKLPPQAGAAPAAGTPGPRELAWAVFTAALRENRPDAQSVRFLDRLLRETAPDAQYVETVYLNKLAAWSAEVPAGSWPAVTVYWLLHGVSLGEEAVTHFGSFPWLRGLLDEAAQNRYDGESLFWAAGYASPQDAEVLLRQAASRYETLLSYQGDFELARQTLEDATDFLPGYAPYLHAVPEDAAAWFAAVQAHVSLREALELPPGADEFRGPSPPLPAAALRARAETWRQRAEALNALLAQLRQPMNSDSVAQLIESSRREEADPSLHHVMDALLATTCLKAEDRAALWKAKAEFARRLQEEATKLDEDRHARVSGPLPGDADPAHLERARRRRAELLARTGIALLRMGGLDPDVLGPLEKRVEKAAAAKDDADAVRELVALADPLRRAWADRLPEQLQQTASLEARRRLGWVFPPVDFEKLLDESATNPTMLLRAGWAKALWVWLADRYRYELRDQQAGSGFFAELARGYQTLSGQTLPEGPHLRLGADGPPRLTAASPAAAVAVSLRLAGPPPKGDAPVRLRVHTAGDGWLQVTPMARGDAADGGLTFAASELPSTLSLRVALAAGAEGLGTPPPRGFMVDAELLGRTYHLLVPVAMRQVVPGPQLLLSADPVAPGAPLGDLRLRPVAVPQPFYLYVNNPTDRPYNVVVQLQASGAFPGASSGKMTVAPGKSDKVVFSAPPPPADAPKPPPAAGTPAPPQAPALAGPLQIRLLDADKGNALLDSRQVNVEIAAPMEYVEVAGIAFDPPPPGKGKNRLTARLRARGPLAGPPGTAELVLPPDRLPGLVGQPDGTFRGTLPPAPGLLTLFATDVRFAEGSPRAGYVYLNVDRYERAFVYRTDFPMTGEPTTPQQDFRPALRVKAKPFAPADGPYAVTLEVDNAPTGATLDLNLGRRSGGAFVPGEATALAAPRQRTVRLNPAGPGGALLFDASVRDWTVPLDTRQVLGATVLRARLLSAEGEEILVVYQPVYLQNTTPEAVRFVNPPKQALKGSTLALQAQGFDSGSGVAKVLFFVGKPADGKVPPTAAPVQAAAVPGSLGLYAAELPLPLTVQGPADVSVQVVNNAGLSTFATTTVNVVEKLPPLLGRVRGTVTEGPLTQPGLTVTLQDTQAKPPAKGTYTATTDAKGVYDIANVPPGTYRVSTARPLTGRVASAEVTVVAGQTAVKDLVLLLP